MTRTFAHRAAAPILLLAAGAVSTAIAQPPGAQPQYEPFRYDYLEAYYVSTQLDHGGLEIGGSVVLVDRVHVFASYLDHELDNNFDRSTFQIGGGYRWTLSPALDFIAELSLASTELDPPGPAEIDEDGFIVAARLRSWISPRVELNGGVALDDSLASDTDVVLEFGGQYYVDRRFSIGGRIRTDDDDTTLFLGGRYHWR